MLTEAADFKAESDALHALLQDKDDADFERPTLFKDWSGQRRDGPSPYLEPRREPVGDR